ncbi:MAG: hypothetical protein PHH49_06180 [Candidatus Omnitrophica bacterium]|nr:hypothetical protein [Candidatus Omnitrophota bacterium]MDD5488528.1 hypothetical protein [Candidatus Omnitrophota bacterium]
MTGNKKASTQKKVIIILAAVFLLNLIYTKVRMNSMFSSTAGSDMMSVEGAELPSFDHKGIVYNGATFRDPMAKPLEVEMIEKEEATRKRSTLTKPIAEQEHEDLVLEGVIMGGPEPLAIISGKVVSSGQIVEAAEVLSISPNKVILERDNKKIELTR